MANIYKEVTHNPATEATAVSYDNGASGLSATNVQTAIDEIANDAASGVPSAAQVNDFASLPAPALAPGEFRYVLNETGSYLLFNKRKRGWYQSDGAVWKYAGDNTRNATDTFFNNASSGLVAVDVESAINEVEARVDINDAKVSANGSINTHSDVDTTTTPPNIGELLEWDGANWVPSAILQSDTITLTAARGNANSTDIWLRQADGLSTNLSPFVIPYNARIVAVTAAGNLNETWDGEVYRNADVRAGGIPLDANKLTEVQVVAANSAFTLVSVDINAGDEIGIFMRGASIDRPSVTIYLERR